MRFSILEHFFIVFILLTLSVKLFFVCFLSPTFAFLLLVIGLLFKFLVLLALLAFFAAKLLFLMRVFLVLVFFAFFILLSFYLNILFFLRIIQSFSDIADAFVLLRVVAAGREQLPAASHEQRMFAGAEDLSDLISALLEVCLVPNLL